MTTEDEDEERDFEAELCEITEKFTPEQTKIYNLVHFLIYEILRNQIEFKVKEEVCQDLFGKSYWDCRQEKFNNSMAKFTTELNNIQEESFKEKWENLTLDEKREELYEAKVEALTKKLKSRGDSLYAKYKKSAQLLHKAIGTIFNIYNRYDSQDDWDNKFLKQAIRHLESFNMNVSDFKESLKQQDGWKED